MNQYTTDTQWIYKMITMYLLMMILWNQKKSTEGFLNTTRAFKLSYRNLLNRRKIDTKYSRSDIPNFNQLSTREKQLQQYDLVTLNNYNIMVSFVDKNGKEVFLPKNHFLRLRAKWAMYSGNDFYKSYLKNFEHYTDHSWLTITSYNEIKYALQRGIVSVFKYKLGNLIIPYKITPEKELQLYRDIIYYNSNNKPGNKCAPIGKDACQEDSDCEYINNKYGFRCTVGKDGYNAPNLNRNNPGHYLHPSIGACIKNNSNLQCPVHYACNGSINKCVRRSNMPIPRIIMKKESSNRLTLNPVISRDDIAECPQNYTVFEDDYKQYCKHDKDPDKICRLDPDSKREYPICSTALCPNNYVIKDNLCVNTADPDDKCTLDPENKEGYLLCGDYNDYIQLENKDIYENNIKKISGINAIQCATECNKNLLCDSFVIDQNTSLPVCSLKKAPKNQPSIIDKENKIVHFKNNINYDQYNNTDAPYGTLESYKVKTPYGCSSLCDKNSECAGFVIDKNTLQCDLKSSIRNTQVNKSKIVFKKTYNEGKLCKTNKQSNIQKEIKDTIIKVDHKYHQELDTFKVNQYDNLDKNQNTRTQIVLNKMINKFSTDTIIWDNINVDCTKISFENLNKRKLYISYIQVVGIHKYTNEPLNIADNPKIKINSDDKNILNIINSSFEEYATPISFDIVLDDEYYITKIIIYNYSKKNNYPLKIILFNKKEFIEKQWIAKTNQSKPTITDHSDIDYITEVYDKGNPELFKSYANIVGDVDSASYCRFVKNDTEFCCKHKKSNNEYDVCVDSDKIYTKYPKSYLFNHNKKTKRENLCWCEGIPPKTNIKCIKTKDNKFSSVYNLTSNIDCSNLTGSEIQRQLKIYEKIVDLSVHSGFYWDRTNNYYLFRNSTINNKKIVLFTIIDADTYKIRYGYPDIVNNNTFPGLTINKEISSILYAGNNDIYVIYSEIYVKYNLLKNKQYNGYPKKVINNWKFLDSNFQNNITNSIYINSNKCLLLNGLKLIEYNLQLIENKTNNVKQSSSVMYTINNLFEKIKPTNYDCIIYNYKNKIYLFFKNNTYTIYNEISKQILTVQFTKQWKNIWKFSN